MMDSQEKVLLPEEPNAETTAETNNSAVEENNAVTTGTTDEGVKKVYKTKKEVVERIKEIAHGNDNPEKEEIDSLKTTFYKLHFAEREAEMKAYLEAGGEPEKYQIQPDEDEEVFKAEMGVIKEKRARIFLEQEKLKQENLKKKLEIIEKIKALTTSPEEANKSFQEFKSLQQEWKEIKLVPAEKANELWRNYQLYVEQFYDLLKLNSEAREYDFKKNLEIKARLCEAAEKLAEESDVISAFHQLQKLHQEFRETGPVVKELRESTWARFKAASTVINKRHQQHFEDLRAKEDENLAKKTELCEKVEAITQEEKKGAADWDKATKEIIAIQAEWKTIGMVPKKTGDLLWNEFLGACNHFFEARNAANAGTKNEERANLEKKQGIIEQLKALIEDTGENIQEKVRSLTDEYNTIGHVPFKEKDKLYKEYHEVLDRLYKELNISSARRRLDNFKNNLKNVAEKGSNALDSERARLMRRYEQMKQEIQTYENNLGFLNAASKKGNSLIDEMNRKVQKLKDDMNLVYQKIKAIDAECNENEDK